MEKFIVRLSWFGLAVALLAPIFPPLAFLIPVLLITFIIAVLLGGLTLLHGAINAVFQPRR
jgi:hypothetical protein